MQYQVPQFIDIEDKIVGPLTLKQFLYLAVGGAIIMATFFLLNFGFAIIIGAIVGTLSFALAFIKVEGMPLPRYIGSMIGFAFKPQEYEWRKEQK
jgi:hypothetical protein